MALTQKQTDALAKLQAAGGKPVVLHVAVGGALVKAGKAIKDDTLGSVGRLQAAYRAAM